MRPSASIRRYAASLMTNDPDPRADALTRLEAAELELAALLEGAVRLASDLASVRESLTVPVAAIARQAPEDEHAAGARLVALDMILSGTPRDEAVLRLAADFPDVDAAALVDAAAATSGG